MRNFYQSKYREDFKALIMHEVESFDLIQNMVREEKFKFMVELGTLYYGLTLVLHEANRKIPLFTFDSMDARTSLRRAKKKVTKEDLEHTLKWGFGRRVTFIKTDVISKKSILLMSLVARPERKLLLGLLNVCDNLVEDMCRHKVKWVRLGEKLHPGDYKKVFPETE